MLAVHSQKKGVALQKRRSMCVKEHKAESGLVGVAEETDGTGL